MSTAWAIRIRRQRRKPGGADPTTRPEAGTFLLERTPEAARQADRDHWEEQAEGIPTPDSEPRRQKINSRMRPHVSFRTPRTHVRPVASTDVFVHHTEGTKSRIRTCTAHLTSFHGHPPCLAPQRPRRLHPHADPAARGHPAHVRESANNSADCLAPAWLQPSEQETPLHPNPTHQRNRVIHLIKCRAHLHATFNTLNV